MKWEYKTVKLSISTEDDVTNLNKLGEEGWELVLVDKDSFYLKRVKNKN